uniref:Uncharacterized protein n=1 Tax=Pseudo-nitzschia delicatissima TaxID=44447 RepID=A0A7S0Y604_9STRA|mmetsp:Transcript_3519/g.7270  ORF Transcript_3519/g.7270 Transcript_3519/m.7270 type:complete len:342 (+) Transcript_3519:55-1080(+)
MSRFNFMNMASASLLLLSSSPFSAMAEGGNGAESGRAERELQIADEDDICYPIPLVESTAGEIFAEEKFLVVTVSEPEDRTFLLDNYALDSTAEQAYTASIDCSLSPGSIRTIVNCTTVVEGVDFDPFSYLMYCDAYATNSVDGANVFSDVNLYTEDTCDCGCGELGDFEFLALLAPDGTCPCTCTGVRADCICYAPYQETLVNIWNELYQEKTDFIGKNITIEGVTAVTALYDCGSPPLTTYNSTHVCIPPDETPSPTRSPTNKPTRHPTNKPTNKPTRKPTRSPTKRPTKRPTAPPTTNPTKRPTAPPTTNPTTNPTVSALPSAFPSSIQSVAPTPDVT